MKLLPISTANPPCFAIRAGMTLIEIAVGLTIITMVAGLGMVGWQSFSRYQAEAEFNNFESLVLATRSKAIHTQTQAEFEGIIFNPDGTTNETTVEKIVNGQSRFLYITASGAILTHLPQHE